LHLPLWLFHRAARPFTPRVAQLVTCPGSGIATCLNRVIDMTGLSPAGLQPCRLLPAPVPCIGTLTLMRSSHLSFSLPIRTTGSHVPHKSLDQGHATSMPDATQAVSRLPPELILGYRKPPVLTSSLDFRHLISGSLPLVSLNLT
jgi:hypothetical protein